MKKRRKPAKKLLKSIAKRAPKNRFIKQKVAPSALTKSKERVKDLGEVFTPDFLVEQMLDQFPDDAWEPDSTWLEPTCGNGAFILGVIKRKIKTNIDKHHIKPGVALLKALNTTFGMDIMLDNIKECKLRIYHDIIIPAVAKYSEKNALDMKSIAVCIVNNNIIHTKDSLEEDWNNRFQFFHDQEQAHQDKELTKTRATLEKQEANKKARKSK